MTQRIISLLLIISSVFTTAYPETPRNISYTLSGHVLSTEGEPVSFAIVEDEQSNRRTVCDIDGNFEITKLRKGRHTIKASSLGYKTTRLQVNISRNSNITIKMSPLSFSLPECEVMAEKINHEKTVINQTAIEYTQPTSLADVFLLLPGSVYRKNTMGRFTPISVRQVGSDSNTAMGTAIITDGAPVTEDGTRTQMVGITESTSGRYWGDRQVTARNAVNQGSDTRQISTDHIQKVEIKHGISSARYGNLSSGTINIHSKQGVSPLRIRLKTDLKNKLAYAGKGFRLGENSGTLHAGADLLKSSDDPRELMDKYSRFTAQTYYNNKWHISSGSISFNARLSQTVTANKMKTDELTEEYEEEYQKDYSRTALMLKGTADFKDKFIDKLELLFSADYTYDKIKRHKMVLASSSPMNIPLAWEEGEHEGIYLPGKYYSDFKIDNKPVNLYFLLDAQSVVNLGRTAMLSFEYGGDFRHTKNYGNGAVIDDPERPPFPYNNSYMRPRRNKDIPAIITSAGFLQTNFRWTDKRDNTLKLSLGGRITQMMNLPSNYRLATHPVIEPRLNASYHIGKKIRNGLRVGYGEENKLPTLDYLYPEKVYKDFYMMNAYTNKAENRRLITYTNIYDMTNPSLRPAKNKKIEAGWDMTIGKFSMSITAFHEHCGTGFQYIGQYYPLTYDLYSKVRPGTDLSNRKPQKEDYIKEEYKTFTSAPRAMNSRKIDKKGIEYRIIFPRIELLKTNIELNGAYYKTNYSSSLDEYYYPHVMIADRPYQYVARYQNKPSNEYTRLNTNLWFNTHLPRFGMMFTNFIQIIWRDTNQYKDKHNFYPVELIAHDGTIIPVTQEIIDRIDAEPIDREYTVLKRQTLPIKYTINEKPVSLIWNIKATKDLSRYARLSFFANAILDHHPKYVSGQQIISRDWTTPYFGVELFINF